MTDQQPGRPGAPDHDDVVETRLRHALTSEAAMVQPTGDGLQKIRAGIDEHGGRAWWRNPAVALAAAAVLGLAVGGVIWAANDNNNNGPIVAHQPDSTPPETPSESGTPSTDPTDTPSQSPSQGPGGAATDVYVYYLHDDGQSPRLYREVHSVTGSGSKAKVALQRMFRGAPDDPDYATPWDNTSLVSYAKTGDTATVDVSSFVAVGAQYESVAVQEIVYTVTANDPSVKKVRLLVGGKTPPSGHTDWSQPVSRQPMSQVQGLIWLLSPEQGATVGSPVHIDGYGTAFEANISWEVRRNGVLVTEGHAQGGANGTFGEFHDTVTLPPGEYEISALEHSAQDGSPLHVDTKTFTVR